VLLAEVSTDGVIATVLYGVVGAAMLVAGFVVLDLATPGSFVERMRRDRSRNAAALAMANLTAVGLIVAVAGWTSSSEDSLAEELLSMVLYGGLGIALQAAFLVVIERGLRDEMDDMLRSETLDPLASTLAVASVVLGVIAAVAVS
jgi:uncharacterized membrane protein YjfL (UPF0719 family)